MFVSLSCPFILFFFFNDTATTEIYTLSLHDALPISPSISRSRAGDSGFKNLPRRLETLRSHGNHHRRDRKSTRLNSSHLGISYAVFCLKKKKKKYEKTKKQKKQKNKKKKQKKKKKK